MVFLAGCATRPKPLQKPAAPAGPKPSYWVGDGVPGAPSIVVDIGDQRAYFYKGEKIVGETKISTGRKGFETAMGSYKVIQKDKDHVSNLYGEYVDEAGEVVKSNVDVSRDPVPEGATFRGAKMPYFLRFYAGYGLHAGRVPDHRASHGCVRLPRAMAEHFFQNAPYGTPVTVQE
jgi:lipoprotein-anchoring transpeptidase ErfK/SrfK